MAVRHVQYGPARSPRRTPTRVVGVHHFPTAGTVSTVEMVTGIHEGTSYTVKILSDGIALEVFSSGSPTGGSSAESYLSATGESFVALLDKLGLAPGELPGCVASLRGGQWRDLWHLVSASASSRFTWFDTDWD